jgi:P27 family predicted phage terminase small subunit
LRNTYRSDRHAGRDPVAPGELMSAPDYLSEPQRRRFAEILKQAPAKVLRTVDQAMLASFVIAEHRLAEINRALQQETQLLTVSMHGQLVIAALHKFQMRAMTSLERAASHLGFSPASRAALKVAEELPRTAEDDYWDRLFTPPTAAENRRTQKAIDRACKTARKLRIVEPAEIVELTPVPAVAKVEVEASKIIAEAEAPEKTPAARESFSESEMPAEEEPRLAPETRPPGSQ